MYRAKDEGRDRCCSYDPTHDGRTDGRAKLEWASRIREALEQDRFLVYAQPIVDPRDQEVQRYELLVRMKFDGEDIILPGAFLPRPRVSGSSTTSTDGCWTGHPAHRPGEGRGADREAGRQPVRQAFSDPELHAIIKAELERTA